MIEFKFNKLGINPFHESILEDLVQDDLVSEQDDFFLITNDQVFWINDIDRKVLGIPLSIPFSISINSNGSLNETEFRFSWNFRNINNSIPVFHQEENNVFEIENQIYLPDDVQYEVLNLIKKHNQEPQKNLEINLEYLARIKGLSNSLVGLRRIFFDKYLENEEVFFAENIRLDFKENTDGTINLLPSIDNEYDESFKKAFDIYPKTKSIYNTQLEEKRIRVLIPNVINPELESLKTKFRKVGGELKEKILKNPSSYFDESTFNLDHYSKRVYELGYYEPKYYPFIKPFSTDWVSGIIIEEASGERVEIKLQNEIEYQNLNEKIKDAELLNSPFIEFKGKNIPLSEAISLKESFLAIKDKKDFNLGFRDSSGKKVLIIYENIEDVSFEDKIPSKIDHVLEFPQRLRNGIKLLDHQKEGIAWLQSLCKASSGALLADDMGLGKTLQVLAFLDWAIEFQTSINSDKPNLIVAPVTLLENWENEQKKFFSPYARVIKYYGNEINSTNLFNLGKIDIVLTTFETLRSKQLILGKVNWFTVVIDEAQRIKTPGTLVTNAAKALNSEFKIAMTGTPVENSWMDLWCITDFIISGLLGSAKNFNSKYNLSLKEKSTNIKKLGDEIRSQLGVYIKRRLKSQILTNLPEKKEFFLPTRMPMLQETEYRKELEYYRKNRGNLNQILSTINRLRMISDHPFLITNNEDFLESDVNSLVESSAKLLETFRILEEIKSKNDKVILFTHFEKVQKILQKSILSYFGMPVNIINGQTANIEISGKFSRQKLIDKFQSKEGFNIIIMSPIAAGYGLNVTGANHVIHYTRHWNPAKENQATDRVYRIGQEKPVNIYFPLAVINGLETFDQKLHSLLKEKNKLSDVSLFPSEACEVKFSDFDGLLLSD
jgi:SNF2 family DNA or RNA helicase